jgi:hypothetical protein
MTGTRPFAERLKTRVGMAVVLAAVALASVVLYLPVTHYGFVWDDDTLITNNSLLAHSGPAEIFSRGFWAFRVRAVCCCRSESLSTLRIESSGYSGTAGRLAS